MPDLYTQEVNRANGTIMAGSKVISNIDRIRVVGFTYPSGGPGGGYGSTGAPEGSCNSVAPPEATCRSWGEPFSEMFYEVIRYFRGLASSGNATTQFYETSGGPDNGLLGLTAEANNGYGDPYTGSLLPANTAPSPLS